jgi:hypothetical protein
MIMWAFTIEAPMRAAIRLDLNIILDRTFFRSGLGFDSKMQMDSIRAGRIVSDFKKIGPWWDQKRELSVISIISSDKSMRPWGL